MKSIFKILCGLFISLSLLVLTGCEQPSGYQEIEDDWTPEKKIEQSIINTYGDIVNRNGYNGSKVVNIAINERNNTFGELEKHLYIEMSGENAKIGKEETSFNKEIITVMKGIEDFIPSNIEFIVFIVYYTIPDSKNDNYNEDYALKVYIPKDKFDMDWDNTTPTDIRDKVVKDELSYWIHPEYKNIE